MGVKRNRKKPRPPANKSKPVDRWLAALGVAVGIILFLLPKSPLSVVLCVTAIFALLAHPVWNFWWIERRIGRRVAAIILLLAGCILIGYVAWPTAQGVADSHEVEPISAAFIYRNHRFEIHNLGSNEFYLCGDKLGDKDSIIRDERPCMDEPATVAREPFHYYILANKLENLVLSKTADKGEMRIPLYVFVTDTAKQKFTIKCLLFIVVENRQITVHTQYLGLTSGWPEEVINLPPSSTPCT
jgi:uncharacterized membrane protein